MRSKKTNSKGIRAEIGDQLPALTSGELLNKLTGLSIQFGSNFYAIQKKVDGRVIYSHNQTPIGQISSHPDIPDVVEWLINPQSLLAIMGLRLLWSVYQAKESGSPRRVLWSEATPDIEAIYNPATDQCIVQRVSQC